MLRVRLLCGVTDSDSNSRSRQRCHCSHGGPGSLTRSVPVGNNPPNNLSLVVLLRATGSHRFKLPPTRMAFRAGKPGRKLSIKSERNLKKNISLAAPGMRVTPRRCTSHYRWCCQPERLHLRLLVAVCVPLAAVVSAHSAETRFKLGRNLHNLNSHEV